MGRARRKGARIKRELQENATGLQSPNNGNVHCTDITATFKCSCHGRECSAPFHLTPYVGKYDPPPTTPDVLGVQKVMAGMADRGATACVYEIDLEAVEQGW